MKMKLKWITLALVAMLSMSVLTACQTNQDSTGSSNAQQQDIALSKFHQAVKDAYGENYIPSMEFTKEELSERFGVSEDWYDDAFAEGPMMSGHVDTFVAIKAKDGKAEEVEKALNAYRDTQINDTLQYPMNIEKVNASKVLKQGNYVFFVMLGGFGEEETEEQAKKYAEEQTQIGVDAINKVLSGK